MQLVVVMAVRKAVSAATMTFTAISTKLCFFISHFSLLISLKEQSVRVPSMMWL